MMNPFGNMGSQQMQQMVQQMMQRNPHIANNPQAQEYLKVIMSGDAQRGQEIAQNLCKTYGITPQEGVQQAQNFFSGMFNNGFKGG